MRGRPLRRSLKTIPSGYPAHTLILSPPALPEAFIPAGSPYLGQALPGEPVCQSNVLLPDRRVS